MSNRYIGRPMKRLEDSKLVRGQGQYLSDILVENLLQVVLLRSPYAHAKLGQIYTAEALQIPGVVAIYTAADLPELYPPASGPRDARLVLPPILARDTVRYVGEPVAAIVATTQAAAEDATLQIYLDYQPLPAYPAPLQAMQADPLHPQLPSNIALQRTTSSKDAAAAFTKAHKVVQAQLLQQRVAPAPLEPRGILAAWDGIREALTVWSSTQMPHELRSAIAEKLELGENQVRVITPDVGGAFGAKINVYPEEILVAYLAKHLGKSVRWVERRSESFNATIHGRAQVAELEMAFDAEGQILGLRGRVVADLGAYALETTLGNLPGTVLMLQGPYEIPAVELEMLGVYTNATPTGAYRGAGRPEATYYLERLLEMGARELGLDPAEIRRKNLITGPFPYKTRTGANYDSGAYAEVLQKLLEVSNYPQLRLEQAQARSLGRLVGIGLCSYVEITGYGWETGGVRVNPDGSAVIFTGASPHGQGTQNAFVQIVADQLGIAPERFSVVQGDTLAVPYGMGTAGSRTLSVGGSAVKKAGEIVRDKMVKIAAHLLEAAPEDIELGEQGWGVRGTDKLVGMEEIVATAFSHRKLPPGVEPGLEGHSSFSLKNANYPFGSHLAMVEVDRDTGLVKILRYLAVDDCGVIVNPLLYEGQQHGGIAQGIGQALYEGIHYDSEGQNLTASFLEYALPKADQIPWMEPHHHQTPSPTNPLGAKGVGEAGAIAATPAVVNAVMDALGIAHLDMPLTPQRVWKHIPR